VRRLPLVLLLLVALFAPIPAHAAPQVVVTVGTSIEAGVGVAIGQSWPSRFADRCGCHLEDRSLPGGAYTHSNEAGDNIRKHVDAAVAELHPDVLILGGPVNDLVGLDVSQIGQLDWAVYGAVNSALTAGVRRVIVMGILPFTDGGAFSAGWWPTLEQRRQQYNTWARDMWGGNNVDLTWALHETTTYRGDVRWFSVTACTPPASAPR
jgi:hypothetical protein